MQLALSSPVTGFFINKKLLTICSLSLIPLLYHVGRNYLVSSRGWHVYEIQYSTISWAVRLLLTPCILLLTVRFLEVTRTVYSFLAIHVTGLFLFVAAHLGISMLLCLQTSSPDRRLWNLFNTLKDQSLITNVVLYSISVLICYLWIYADKSEVRSMPIAAANAKPIIQIAERTTETLNIKSGRQTEIVKFTDILSVSADGHYTRIVTENRAALMSVSMRDVGKMLPSHFVRIHRSTIVNTLHIAKSRSLMNGDYVVTMKNGDQFRVSRTYRDDLRKVLGNF